MVLRIKEREEDIQLLAMDTQVCGKLLTLHRRAMVLMQKPSVIESPSSRVPEKVPRWDLTGTEGCGGGKVFSWLPLMVLGYKSIYGRKNQVRRPTWGPQDRGGVPSTHVAASRLLQLHLQVSWFASGPRKIIMKVSFRFDSVWYSFSVKL